MESANQKPYNPPHEKPKRFRLAFRLVLIISLFFAALIIYLVILFVRVSFYKPPNDLNSIIQKARYPNSSNWSASYDSSFEEGPETTACFDTQDSRETVLNYYENYFTKEEWAVSRKKSSGGDILTISKSDGSRYSGTIGQSDSSTTISSCKFYIYLRNL